MHSWRAMSLAVLLASGPAAAADISIGLSAPPSSADPYFHQLTPNEALADHVFGSLIGTDRQQRLQPDLATGWVLQDDDSWKFTLRPGVTFHDGTPFTADDVVYSLCRVLHPSGPTQSYVSSARAVDRVEVPDPHSIVLHMAQPDSGFLSVVSILRIISAHSAAQATGAPTSGLHFSADGCGLASTPAATDFDSLRMANGTGPYRLVHYVSGTSAELAANPGYYGARAHWDHVTFRPVPNAGSRLAGLLTGEFDLIENPAAQDLPTLKQHGGLAWTVVPSNRILYLQPDIGRADSPLVRAPDGKNPLREARVREAMSLAIDRKAITGRLMEGMGVPADQFATPGLFGALAHPPPRPYDPAQAKKLLAEAGYGDGFAVTLSATNDRYIDDATVAQAIGQYLTRVGIRTTVDTMPSVVFFPTRTARKFSLSLGGWGYSSEGAANLLRVWVVSTDPVRAIGGSNYGGYHSEAFDRLFLQALGDMHDDSRAALLGQAQSIALHDNALIPLYWETTVWAFKDKYVYTGRSDQRTDADDLAPKGN